MSPSSAITPISLLTCTFSDPSGKIIEANLPSSIASTSIVALSVSTSAIMSPETTSSPTFLIHFAIFPSVMVGESAGINKATGISQIP